MLVVDANLVAIAKNEARYLPEWIAYHLAIGYDQIIIYDNESDDGTSAILRCIGERFPVHVISWPSVARFSPQRSAYAHSLSLLSQNSWVSFFDIDEFIVPWKFDDIKDFFSRAPVDAGSIAVNWRCFGSSGLENDDYDSVISTFRKCSSRQWRNNCHIKSSARVSLITEPHIHEIGLAGGRRLASDFTPLRLGEEGKTIVPIYGGIQLNHYQTKTWTEFFKRMERGNANFPKGHPNHQRVSNRVRFNELDQNCEDDYSIDQFHPGFEDFYSRIRSMLARKQCP